MRLNYWRILGTLLILLSAVLVCEGIAHAAPTRAEVKRAVDPAFRKPPTPWIVFALAAVADVATTEAALHNRCHENNPVYGRHPSLPLLVGLHAIPLALAWPVKRSPWLYAPAALFAGVAIHNATLRCR